MMMVMLYAECRSSVRDYGVHQRRYTAVILKEIKSGGTLLRQFARRQ